MVGDDVASASAYCKGGVTFEWCLRRVVSLGLMKECAPHNTWWILPWIAQKPRSWAIQPTNIPSFAAIQQTKNQQSVKQMNQLTCVKQCESTVIHWAMVSKVSRLNNKFLRRARGPSASTERHFKKTSQYPYNKHHAMLDVGHHHTSIYRCIVTW